MKGYLKSMTAMMVMALFGVVVIERSIVRTETVATNDRSRPKVPSDDSEDPRLIDFIRHHYLDGPSNLPLVLPWSMMMTNGQPKVVDKIFNKKLNGTFIEAGAFTGVSFSNTVFLEQDRGWSGLLIEMNPENYRILREANRRSYSSNSCLSITNKPEEMNFQSDGKLDHSKVILDDEDSYSHIDLSGVYGETAQCFPLQSLLNAVNLTNIDYFSLDVEGLELKVLKAFPFEKFNITVISVEHLHIPEGKAALISFMKSKNYTLVKDLYSVDEKPLDAMFVHNDFIPKINMTEIQNMEFSRDDFLPIDRKLHYSKNMRI